MATNYRIFKRKIYEQMLQWKQNRNGSTALLIKGARRVGKSTIAEEFARREYESYIVVDFANAPASVWEAIERIASLDDFLMTLQFIYGVRLYERRSVIIFDEVQKCPAVRQAIKYMVKDRRYDYIETGSLLSIKKNTKGIVIPSEETRLTMYPMDYEEFRWALGDTATISLLRESFTRLRPFGDAVTRKLLRDLRLYMLVGGMPQAVNTYLDTNNLTEVDNKKREILELYDDDFLKIDPSGKAGRMFAAIPSQLSKNASRYQATSVLGRSESEDTMTELLTNLEDSLTVNISHHADDPNVGMPMHTDYSQYKMFIGDTRYLATLTSHSSTLTEALRVLGFANLRDRSLCQRVQRQLNVGHIVTQIFLLQAFIVLVLSGCLATPTLRDGVCKRCILLTFGHACSVPFIRQFLPDLDAAQSLVNPFVTISETTIISIRLLKVQFRVLHLVDAPRCHLRHPLFERLRLWRWDALYQAE